MRYKKDAIKEEMMVMSEHIGLPTTGATINSIEYVDGCTTFGRTGNFYRVSGAIHPVDPAAPDIQFQAGFPEEWNGKAIQYGGGGLDGLLFPVEYLTIGRSMVSPSPMRDGYIVFASDGGHTMDPNAIWDCSWSLNDEAFLNFAYAALKKVRDVVFFLTEKVYDKSPGRIYFAGGSNGGRECMKMMQMFPDAYDGAVCFYPVLCWILKVIADNRNADVLADLGEDAWIDAETYQKVQNVILKICDGLDGVEDGIISNYRGAREKENEILKNLKEVLNEKQIQMILQFASPVTTSFPLGYGRISLPGYAALQGAPLIDSTNNMFGKSAADRTGAEGADGVIACQVMRNKDFDAKKFNPELYEEELTRASKLLDAYSTDLDAFWEHGNKMLLVQGTADTLVTPDGTIQYYEALKERYGENLGRFLKFYLIPGYGHAYGDMFNVDADWIKILDDWVENGNEPGKLIVTDCNENSKGRTRPIYEYPFYAFYKGEGDEDDAESYEASC